MHEWQVYESLTQASQAAAEFIIREIQNCLLKQGECHIALPGGNTPAACLELVSQATLDWDKVYWYLGDERCLPAGDTERNDVMLTQHLFRKLPVAHVYTMATESGAEQAAEAYRNIIDKLQALDIVFLGMGEDGHTASLFPDNPALLDERSVVAVYDSPKPPAERVSLGLQTLRKASLRMVLTAGDSKKEIIQQIYQGADLPVNMLGDIHWFIDKASMPEAG